MKTMVTEVIVCKGELNVLDEYATRVRIEDEGAGPYVMLDQSINTDARAGMVGIEAKEWPELRKAINEMFISLYGNCNGVDHDQP